MEFARAAAGNVFRVPGKVHAREYTYGLQMFTLVNSSRESCVLKTNDGTHARVCQYIVYGTT